MTKKNIRVKHLLSLVLALCMVLSACPLSSFVGSFTASAAARQGSPAFSTLYWEYYNDGEIRFTGDIRALTDTDTTPWKNNDGTNYGDYVTVITIANTVRKIGSNAFKGLKPAVIGIPKTVEQISSDAFVSSQIKDVYYEGTQAEWKSIFSATVLGLTVHYGHRHTGEVLKHAVAATCTQPGYEGDLYCSLCGAFYANGKATEKTAHVWSDGYAYIDGRAPQCNKAGEQAKYCVNCGTFDYSTKMDVPATGIHEWVVLPGDKYENCQTHMGEQIDMHCKNCSVSSKDSQFQELTYKCKVDADSDAIVDTGISEFLNLTEAQRALVVNAEKVAYNQNLKKLSTVQKDENNNAKHHYVYDTTDPTCTEDGKTSVSCEWCNGYSDTYVVPAKGHSDAALGHTISYVVPATCTEAGERGTRCSVCGEVLTSEVIPDNHTKGYYSGTWKTIVKPDCVNDGYQWLVCNYCGEYIKDDNNKYVMNTLDKTPDVHTASRWFTTLEPTCTEKGEQIKICTVKGCPYYSDTLLGKSVVKISDRKALDELIAVTKDTDKTHFQYNASFPNDDRVFDVANEVNMVILAAYKKGDYDGLDKALVKVFQTAVEHHGYAGLDQDGKEKFFFDNDTYNVDPATGDKISGIADEPVGDVRYVFAEITERAVELLIEKESVINTTEEVVSILEEAWTELGTEEIGSVVAENRDLVAKVTDKALAKQEIAENGHDYVRCDYIVVDNEFIPVCEKEPGSGEWYRIAYYEDAGQPIENDENEVYKGIPVASDERVEGKAVTEVNCVNGGGNMISQCRTCLKLAEPTLVKQGSHKFQTKPVAATCYEKGYELTYCTVCDYRTKTVTSPKLEHNYVETTIKDSTCSKAGIKVKICTHCGDVDKSTYQTLALLPHSDSAVREDATCTEAGRNGNVCSVCGRFDGQILPALGHSYKEEVIPPTCTELGYTVATCTRCGDTKSPEKFVAVAGHQFGKAINVAATCEEGAYTYEQCRVCGFKKIYNEQNNALGHLMTSIPAKAATCTEDGYTEKIFCTRPGCSYVEKESVVVPKLGHNTVTVPRKEATCHEEGYESYIVCTVCGVETQPKVVIAKLHHSWETIEAVEPTCTQAGNQMGRRCELCGDYDKYPTVIQALGHDFGEAKITKEATPFTEGTKTSACKNCGEKKTETYKLTFWQSVLWFITLPFRIFSIFLPQVNTAR